MTFPETSRDCKHQSNKIINIMNQIKFFGAFAMIAGTLAVTACSEQDDYTPDTPVPDNAIRFAANTEFSRADDITTNNLQPFNVYAYTGNYKSVYMENVKVTKTGANAWTYSPAQYWPADQTLDFYAFAPASWVGDNSPLKPVP